MARAGVWLAQTGRRTWKVLKRTGLEFVEDRAPKQSAALSYYALFAIGPLLLVAVSVAGLVFGVDNARQAVTSEIARLLGPQGADAVQGLMEGSDRDGRGIAGLVFGLVALLAGAVGVFQQLRDSLDTIWEVRVKPVDGWMRKVVKATRDNLVGLVGLLGTGFLLLVSLALGAAISAAAKWANGLLPGDEVVWLAVHWSLSVLVAVAVFALVFKYLPRARVAWRDVMVGAVVTGILFVVGEVLIGLYIGQTATASRYGAAGAVLVVILWVYYSSLLLFFGAELTQVYANLYGSRVRPAPDAESLQASVARRQDPPDVEGRKDPSGRGRPYGHGGSGAGRPHRSRDIDR